MVHSDVRSFVFWFSGVREDLNFSCVLVEDLGFGV